ncbi:MAG: HEAT repeat domain-containing protein [Planctomycetes bacterium]|nr:HEAT repeat domain-containing protein [Planctomycetota bacterium]
MALILAIIGMQPAAQARSVPPAPNPGLDNAVRAADAIAEVEVLAGGPFRAVASVRRTIKGSLPAVIELQGFNSVYGNVIQNAYTSGKKYILFLSRTDAPDVFAPLTPTTPRMGVEDGEIELVLGDPPFSIPVKPADMNEAFALLMERDATGAPPERAAGFIRNLWEQQEIELRYMAVTFAGYLRDPRCAPLAIQASADKLLRLRLTAVEALGRIATPEALAALRALLKDERSVVAQEAAGQLLGAESPASLEDLLKWSQGASSEIAKLAQTDPRRNKLLTLISRLLLFADRCGPLLPAERLCPLLLDLAKMKDVEPAVASDALYVYGTLAQAAQVGPLIELADDPVYAQRSVAAAALARVTLHSTASLETFRSWWKDARAGFGEDYRRTMAESAAQELAAETDPDMQASLVALLRMTPPAAALVSAAPVLLDEKRSAAIDGVELNFWRSMLAVPFLVERLGWDDPSARRAALDGLALLAQREPRLRELARRFARAAACDTDSMIRRYAYADSGALDDGKALPALIEALRDPSTFESESAAAAVYRLSARTLGLGEYEPLTLQESASRRLEGWWKTQVAEKKSETWKAVGAAGMESAPPSPEERKELERLLKAPESRPAEAAFAELFRACGPGDALWTSLLESNRVLDRAHGVLGLSGGEGAHAAKLSALLSGPKADAAVLVRALAVLSLGSLKDGKGAAALVDWWTWEGEKAKLPWRRLALLSCALADGEPRSLGLLTGVVDRVLAFEKESSAPAAEAPDRPLLLAALLALSTRTDGTDDLTRALALKAPGLRELALRALALRRAKGIAENVLAAMKGVDRAAIPDLARMCEPLLGPGDAKRLREMLLNGNDSSRLAAASIFAARPELAREEDSRAALLEACKDLAPPVRSRAAEALGLLRRADAVPALAEMLADADSDAAASAAEAVGRSGDPAACAKAARLSSRLFRRDLRWFRAIGLGAGEVELAALLRLTASDIWVDRCAGFTGLGFCFRPASLERLVEVYRDNDSPSRSMAAEALVNHGDDAVKALDKDLADAKWQVRAQALELVGRLALPSAAARLLKGLSDPDERVRLLANLGLIRISGGKDAKFDPRAEPAAREAAAKRWPELLPKELRPE